MTYLWSEKVSLGLVILLAFGHSMSRAENSMSADEVIQKAAARAQQPEGKSGKRAYTYTKLTVMEEFDSSGKVKEHKEKVYQVNLRNGATFAKLIEVNGHAPAEADLKKQAENESNARQMAGSTKRDTRETFLTPEVVERFDFTLLGRTNFNGRATYQIGFQPKNPVPPTHHMVDRLLDRISGKVWIDAEEFEIARAEINLGSEVNLLGGVVGSLKKLAYTMTCTRIDDGVWLKTSSFGDFEGRKLVDAMRIKTSSRAINCRPLL
jgi:hypothetical protein